MSVATLASIESAPTTAVFPRSKRVGYLDAMRIICIFGVVAAHVTCGPAANYDESLRWWTAHIITALGRFRVPVLVMLSGALLLDGRRMVSLSAFYKKRLTKILVPLAAWGLLYQLHAIWLFKAKFTLGDAFLRLLTGEVAMHLWFLYMMVFIYLAAPFLNVIAANVHPRTLWAFAAIAFVMTAVVPLIEAMTYLRFRYYNLLFSDYLGYFVLGHLLHRHLRAGRAAQVLGGGLLYLAGAAVTLWGSYVLTRQRGAVDLRLLQYPTANVVMMAAGFFIFMHGIAGFFEGERLGRPLAALSGACYGVYLAHIMVMYTLNYKFLGTLMLTSKSPAPLQFIVNSVTILAVTLLFTMALRRIPLVRRIVP